ncbi:MAG: PVC-type heme-binding CxxCH protein, partial [Planctomycetaceae bacterium]
MYNTSRVCLVGAALFLTHVAVGFAQSSEGEAEGPRNTQQGTPPTPEEAVAKFTAPEGFRVTLFAGEPKVTQPIALTTDERGRVWVAENDTYAEVAVNFSTRLHDRIVILEDNDRDGRCETRKVFWEAAPIAVAGGPARPVRLTSVEVGFGGVWAICAPYLVFIPDRNRDDIPDGPPQVLLDGWNDGAVRHNIVNGLKWGPDGWLYGRHGILANSLVGKPGSAPSQRIELNCSIWRYHPTRHQFEVVAHGTTNPWGFDYDEHGQMFFINTVIGHLFHLVPGAHYRRMYGADFNPHLYELIDATSDHFHWDTGEKWSDIRAGMSDTTSRAGGGHAHSGLMIYQGDNWPDEYRNTVFTINFHGHRLNADHLRRHEAGYIATHGKDVFFANNEWFRGLDLVSGPDGSVYVADWSDAGECHENDGVHRTSGRIYRLTYGEPGAITFDDLSKMSDAELVSLQLHRNDWYVRQTRRLLQERAADGRDLSRARAALLDMFSQQKDETRRLRALWCLYGMGAVDEEWLSERLVDPSEHVRLWAIRLLADKGEVSAPRARMMTQVAATERSALVRLYLASALQRMAYADRWELAGELLKHQADASDRALPLMIWYGIEPAAPADPKRAVALATESRISFVRRHIARRLTSGLESDPSAVDRLVQAIGASEEAAVRLDLLTGMRDALRGWRKAPVPASWPAAMAKLEASSPELRDLARQIGVVFGDGRAVEELRKIALDGMADIAARRSAVRTLIDDRAPELSGILKQLLADAGMVREVVPGLAVVEDPEVPALLLGKYPNFDPTAQGATVDTLTSRPSYARALLAAVEAGAVERSAITAFHARQVQAFQDKALTDQLVRVWGAVRETSEEKHALMNQLRTSLTADVLAKADLAEGRRMFEKSCASCHVLYGTGGRIGPDLTGSNRHNLNYLLENIVDPSASVGKPFQVSVIELNDGRVVTGIVVGQTERTLSVQTQKEVLTINRDDVSEIAHQAVSLMPDGLLAPLKEDEIRNLFGYLSSRAQVPLPELAEPGASLLHEHGNAADEFVLSALRPFWRTNQIDEPSMFIQRSPDQPPSATLLFAPEDVALVRSANRKIVYESGKDFVIDAAARKVTLPAGSRIPYLTTDDLYPLMTSDKPKIGRQAGDKSRGIYFDNAAGYHERQVEIHYRHA